MAPSTSPATVPVQTNGKPNDLKHNVLRIFLKFHSRVKSYTNIIVNCVFFLSFLCILSIISHTSHVPQLNVFEQLFVHVNDHSKVRQCFWKHFLAVMGQKQGLHPLYDSISRYIVILDLLLHYAICLAIFKI